MTPSDHLDRSKIVESDVEERHRLLKRRLSKPAEPGRRRLRMKKRMPYVKWQIVISALVLGFVSFFFSELERQEFTPLHERQSPIYRYLTETARNATAEKCPVLSTNATTTTEEEEGGDFPKDPFTLEQRKNGAVIFHVLVMVYMFAGLAIVCDSFFESALERICIEWNISNDVAGATYVI